MQTIQSTFASNLNTADPEIQRVQQRSLNTLYMVVKALCSKMLPASRKVFQQLAPELLQYIGTIFTDRCNHFLHYAQVLMTNAGSGDEQAENALRIGLIALKTLRRVVVYGFIEFWNVKEIANFAEVLLGCLQKFIDLRRCLLSNASKCSSYEGLNIRLLRQNDIPCGVRHTQTSIFYGGPNRQSLSQLAVGCCRLYHDSIKYRNCKIVLDHITKWKSKRWYYHNGRFHQLWLMSYSSFASP